MRLMDAIPLLEASCNKPFKEIFINHPEDLRTNKGNVGQLLLLHIGLKLDSAQCDFEDGELKTNKAAPNGMPRETMFVSQISNAFPTLVSNPPTPFEQSYFHQKTRNLLYLPTVKDAPLVADWYFSRVIHIQSFPGSKLFEVLRREYDAICESLRYQIEHGSDGMIHTTNGPSEYVQIRTKDSKPYHPIYSPSHKRYVSTKNCAWYFMKGFMEDAIRENLPS
jgi:DNA mismatch repair protein MutH